MMIVWIIVGVLFVLLGICLMRAVMMKETPAAYAKIDMVLEERSFEYGEGLGKMIRCETISSREDYDITKFYRFHEVLKQVFPIIFDKCEVIEIDANLLFKWKGKQQREPILLMSHQDVVEATGEWMHDPFGGEVIDEKVWGRGTVDTKGNLFCMMQAVEELLKEGYQPECDVYIASSATEEISGDGAPKLVKYLQDQGVRLRLVLDEGGMIMEGPIGGLKGIYGMVGVLEKGHGNLRFVAKGRGGHASAPKKGTPIPRLAAFINRVEKHDPFTPKMNSTVAEMFRRFAPNMGFGARFLIGNMWLFRPLVIKVLPRLSSNAGAMIKTTIAFTMAEGSAGTNVLPQTAWVNANMRYIPHQPEAESIELITKLAAKYDVQTEVFNHGQSCPVTNYKSKEFNLIEEVMSEIYPGVGVAPYAMTGGTDCKFFPAICDNCLRFAPLYINHDQLSSIHGLNETIDLASLTKGVDFFKCLIKKS